MATWARPVLAFAASSTSKHHRTAPDPRPLADRRRAAEHKRTEQLRKIATALDTVCKDELSALTN